MTTVASAGDGVLLPETRSVSVPAYLRVLAVVLFAYAVGGKSFAYLGLPPIFMGELMLLLGLVTLPLGSLIRVVATGPGLLLLLWMYWCLWRTIPFVPTHGFDSFRDAAAWGYAALALVVGANLVHAADPWPVIERWLVRFAWAFPPCILALWLWDSVAPDSVPVLSSNGMAGAPLPLFYLKPGDVQVHLAGCFLIGAFLVRRHRFAVMVMAALGILLFGTANRGGLVAAITAVAVAGLLRPHRRAFWIAGGAIPVVVAAMALFTALQPLTDSLGSSQRERSVSQLLENVQSIVDPEGAPGNLAGTRQWRLQWWTLIIDKSLHDEGGWLGRGFGLNLADADGFQVVDPDTRGALRSPHNIHMTMLARAGIPGLALWAGVVASLLIAGHLGCRRFLAAGRSDAGFVLLVTAAYALALLVNATFDVAIEGPMAGIWFWSLAGVLLAGACFRLPLSALASAHAGPVS